jgi:hypothetical protein
MARSSPHMQESRPIADDVSPNIEFSKISANPESKACASIRMLCFPISTRRYDKDCMNVQDRVAELEQWACILWAQQSIPMNQIELVLNRQ